MKQALSDLRASGYAFMDRLMPDRSTYDVACSLGEPIALPEKETVHRLKPAKPDPRADHSYSGRYG